jgi:glycosyltransferase involved in cell wall biosynthesis
MDTPLISIVTVVYNGASTLEQTILSVINQTYKNIEYIIIDGGSTDGTIDIIKKYEKHLAYWVSEPDEGIYDAMNKGIDKATGEWINFLGSDDVIYTHSTLDICGIFMNENIYYGNVILKEKNKLYPLKINSAYQLCLTNFSHQAIFYPKEIYKNIKYDLRYKLWADYVYNLYLYSKFRDKFVYLNHIIVVFNDKGLGSLNKDMFFIENRLSIIKLLFGTKLYYMMKIRYLLSALKGWILISLFQKFLEHRIYL